jgi:hypothetical protein
MRVASNEPSEGLEFTVSRASAENFASPNGFVWEVTRQNKTGRISRPVLLSTIH